MKVLYIGHVGKKTGYGRAGEHLCNALMRRDDIDLAIIPLLGFDTDYLSSLPLASNILPAGRTADVVIAHELPMSMRTMLDNLRQVARLSAPIVAYTTWEAQNVPTKLLEALDGANQVWTPDTGTAIRLSAHGGTYAVPHPFDVDHAPIVRENVADQPYTFLWYGAINARKNPHGLIRAFCRAFKPTDDVRLIIHSTQLTKETAAALLAQTGMEQRDMPRIQFSNTYENLEKHLAVADCFVTASRGEAWNLPAFEATVMAGMHAIVPVRQGSSDYLDNSSTTFIDVTDVPAWLDVASVDGGAALTISAQGLTTMDDWLEPDLFDLTIAMRMARTNKTSTIAWFGANPREKYSYAAVGAQMKGLLELAIETNRN